MKDNNCILAEVGDRLGMSWEEAPNSVAYSFLTNTNSEWVYMKHESSPISAGEEVTFNTVRYPYKISLSAYLDTSKNVLSIRELSRDFSCTVWKNI